MVRRFYLVDGIRKYSKEWFTLNGGASESQLEALKGLEKGLGKSSKYNKTLSQSVFTGTKEEMYQKIEDMTKNMHGAPSSTYLNIQTYGADNIFNALDIDGDGVVTEQEIKDVAALSTSEFAAKDDTTLSTDDLDLLYQNAMEAVNSSFVNMGNKTEFHYENGDKTTINLDNKGNISSKSVEEYNEDGSKTSVSYDYSGKIITTSNYDEQGRVTQVSRDADGIEDDYIKTFTYNDDGSKSITTEDFIGTSTRVYDTTGNLVSKDVQYNYDSDGVIDDTKQRSIGDCWVLAGVNSLRDSAIGAQMLKDSIQQNDDGSVTVTLKGVGKEYTYSAEEIIKNQYDSPNLKYSSGDTDMNLFEMAIGDYRKELIASGDYTKNGRDLSRTAGKDATVDDPLKGGQIDEAIYYITGLKSEYASRDIEAARDMIETYENSTNKYIMNVTFQEKDESITEGTITTGHAYSITKVDEDYVYVVNPWNSSVEIPYPREEFLQNTKQITLTDLTPGVNETYFSPVDENSTFIPGNPDEKGTGSKIKNLFKQIFS